MKGSFGRLVWKTSFSQVTVCIHSERESKRDRSYRLALKGLIGNPLPERADSKNSSDRVVRQACSK